MVTSGEKKGKKKEIAKESGKTRKAREKLQKRFEIIDSQITKEAMEKKTSEIHRWISRNHSHRVSLKSKSIALFDENKNAAEISIKIAKIAEQLQKDQLSE